MQLKKMMLATGCLLLVTTVQAQTQMVRGTITDNISQEPIPGASVVVLNTNPVLYATSDENGMFRISSVPVGKQSFKISFMGYKEVLLQNMSVNAGKELVLNIVMEEEINQVNEVVINANTDKNKPLNEMSTVSTRTFSVEETQKFAAAVNDPGRMASSFAGVVSGHDGNNMISIRGNSPNGLLWRMEGVEIPNPNHFSSVGTSGGGISILSAQLLSNSDFSTGAFAAEYGNALSGVFDLRLRKGNNEKREYTFQAGILGIDAAAEGPFKKGYGGSFLINYRYSTLNILGKMGVPIGDANTNFQDLSFNVSLPAKKAGTFGVFGFGGISTQKTNAEKDTAKWNEDSFFQLNTNFYAHTGAAGISHVKLFSNQAYLKTVLVFSGTRNGYLEEKLDNNFVSREQYNQSFDQGKITLSSVYTQKLSPKNSIRTGFILNQLQYRLINKEIDTNQLMIEKLNVKDHTYTTQAFFQWNHKMSDQFSTNLGVHYLALWLNQSQSVEPRVSLRYAMTEKHVFTLGYGLHSQVQPLGLYFSRQYTADGAYTNPNKNLGLSQSHHLVLGYDWVTNAFSHIKTEVYYQYLFNVPVSTNTNDAYSILNVIDGYTDKALVNKGHGRNYGLELTCERFLHRNFYYLLSVSLYNSEFEASNGKWYNTRFNTNYASSLTMGKEWMLSEKRKNRIIGVNIKSLYTGGLRYTPIDLEASTVQGETVLNESEIFAKRVPDYFRFDLRVSCKRNYKKVTTTLALDIQNVTNRENVGGQYFDTKTNTIKYYYQTPLIPVLSYRLEF